MARPFDDELHVSSDHMGEDDLEILSARGGRTSMIGGVAPAGVVLHIDFYSEENDPEGTAALQLREDGYSAEFVNMVCWAAALGARTLRLDEEGKVMDALPVFGDGSGSGPRR